MPANHQFAGGKQGIPHIGDDQRAVVERFIEPAHQPRCGDGVGGRKCERALGGSRARGKWAGGRPGTGRNEGPEKIGKAHVVEMVVADAQFVAGGKDTVGRLDRGGENAEIEIGQQRAEQNDAVAFLDKPRHLLAAQSPFVEADKERMNLTDHAFGQQG